MVATSRVKLRLLYITPYETYTMFIINVDAIYHVAIRTTDSVSVKGRRQNVIVTFERRLKVTAGSSAEPMWQRRSS